MLWQSKDTPRLSTGMRQSQGLLKDLRPLVYGSAIKSGLLRGPPKSLLYKELLQPGPCYRYDDIVYYWTCGRRPNLPVGVEMGPWRLCGTSNKDVDFWECQMNPLQKTQEEEKENRDTSNNEMEISQNE